MSDEAEEDDDVSVAWEDLIPAASGGDIVLGRRGNPFSGGAVSHGWFSC